MKQIVTAMAVLLLAGFALADLQTNDMLLHSGATTNALNIALPASAACTTNWVSCQAGRTQSLYWREWVEVGATDSARVKIDYQRAVKDKNFPVTALDTLISLAVSHVLDTTGAPRCLDRQYWPKPCLWIRYIITALSGNSDVTHVGGFVTMFDSEK